MNVRKVCKLIGYGVKHGWLLVWAFGVWLFGMIALMLSGAVLVHDDHKLGELLISYALPVDTRARLPCVVVLVFSVLLISRGARQLDNWWPNAVGARPASSKESI